MFHKRDDPLLLQDSLESLVDKWIGYRRPWYGVESEKLDRVELPQPLRWLYSFAGYWPSNNWHEHLFGTQNGIVPFECLSKTADGEKLIFGSENQGCWIVSTLPVGDDPPVWVSFDDEPWTLLTESLMEFLVTFCIQEIIYGSFRLGSGENLIKQFRDSGKQVTPIWLSGPFVSWGDDPRELIDFYLVDNCILATEDRCGWSGGAFESDSVPEFDFVQWKELPSQSQSGYSRYTVIPDEFACQMPEIMKENHYRDLIGRHEEQALYHLEMVRKYTSILLNNHARNQR